MLVGGVIHDQVGDNAQATAVGVVNEFHEVIDGAEFGQDFTEVADIVTAVAQWGIIKRWDPNAIHAEPLDVIQFFG